MQQTVIGEIYYSLEKKELKELDKYIHSSVWNKSETIVKCHDCLSHYTQKGKLEELDKEKIYQFVYDGESYVDSKMRFTLNRLLIAIKEFVILQQFENKNIFAEKIWMDFLIGKKLKKNIQYSIENDVQVSNTDYKFIFQYFKSQENNFHKFNFTKDIKSQYHSIVDIMRSAEIFSDLVFIKNYCLLISFSSIYQSMDFNLPIDKLNEIKAKKWDEELPEFAVYMSLLDLLIKKDDDSYHNYKKYLFDHIELLDDDEKITLLVYLLNFSTGQINKGNTAFIDEQYDLFNLFEEKGVFSIKNYINHTRINNVVHIFLRKKEYEKAEQFVKKYVQFLGAEVGESCLHFNLARIQFEMKFYKGNLEHRSLSIHNSF